MLIALAGKAGSGKDTVASMLPGHWTRLSFAAPLKEFCRQVFGFTTEQLYGPSEKRNAPDTRWPRDHGPWAYSALGNVCACCRQPDGTRCYLTPRYALQTLGTEWGRAMHPDTWAAAGVRLALERTEQGADVVLTDCRFANEARKVIEAGGQVWRITRPGAGLSVAHASELEIDTLPATLTILNDGSLDDLRGCVERLANVDKCRRCLWPLNRFRPEMRRNCPDGICVACFTSNA